MSEGIYLHEVSKKFGNEEVLSSCTAYFRPGKIYGLMGRNGTGKSVLLKLICGLYLPDSGFIEVFGKKIGEGGTFAENIGALIETPGFLNGYTGFQNLQFLAEIQHRIGEKEIQDAMEEVGLDWKSKKRVGKYSLGMKQRLGIAQVIMEGPAILLLDEPMNGLDEAGVKKVRSLILKKKEEGKLILLASHIKEDLEILCDEVYEIQNCSLYRISFEDKDKSTAYS